MSKDDGWDLDFCPSQSNLAAGSALNDFRLPTFHAAPPSLARSPQRICDRTSNLASGLWPLASDALSLAQVSLAQVLYTNAARCENTVAGF
jgi:hypothetical protein